MKTDDNGIIREMTDAEMKALAAEPAVQEPPQAADARLDEIEAALMELAALLGGGEDG